MMRRKHARLVERTGFMLLGTAGALWLVILLRRSSPTCSNDVVVKVEEVTTGVRVKAAIQTRTSSSSPPSWPSCQRNTSMAHNVTGFSSLPAHIQDFLYYRHCRHFPLLLDVPDKCGGPAQSGDVFLLLVIKSSPENYERREVLRKTWAEERMERGKQIRRLFLVGTMDSGFARKRLNQMLELEQREHRDVLQWDIGEAFFNLTLKQVLFLEWMDRNCPDVRFLFNGDDDVFANTDNMVDYLLGSGQEGNGTHLFVGSVNYGMQPIRDPPSSKYYVPVQVQQSEAYPPYCGGGGYLLSGYTATIIYNMSKNVTLHPIDDVYMGMCLAEAGLKPTHHNGVLNWGLEVPSKEMDPYHPCFYREILVVHRFMPLQIYVMWHKVRDPSIKCGSLAKRIVNGLFKWHRQI